VIRLTFLGIALAALIPFSPLGCPPTDDGTEPTTPVERGEIPTLAAAVEEASVGEFVLLEATTTADTEDGTIYYAWLQTDGRGVAIQGAEQPTASFVAPSLMSDETLAFMVTTRNDAGDVGRAEASVLVKADPRYGTSSEESLRADAGTDQSALPGETVSLNGSASTGEGLSHLWTQLRGQTVTLANADSAVATFTAPPFDADGSNILEFQLTVTSSDASEESDTVEVRIEDPLASGTAPVADAGADQAVAGESTVTLDGSASTGTALSYRWRQTGGPGVQLSDAESAVITFTAPEYDADQVNVCVFELTVFDASNRSASDRVEVTLLEPDPGDAEPVADAGPDASVQGGAAVVLDGTGSTGSGLRYAWSQTFGPDVELTNADASQPRFAAPAFDAGDGNVLEFELTVTDDQNRTASDRVRITIVEPGTVLPVADAGTDQTVVSGETVTLDGSASTGTDLTYSWEQVSGPEVELASVGTASTTFVAPDYEEGNNLLEFEVTVTDGNDATATDRVEITVNQPATTRVRVATSLGDFVVELDREQAPVTVENFLQYVDEGFYNGTLFHRVIPGFVIQGGGFLPGLNEKETHDPIINESDNGLLNVRASVAMARLTDPDSATSQFYINLVENDFLDYADGNPGYAVFGEVVDGMTTVDRIAAVDTHDVGQFSDVPVQDVIIRSVTRLSGDQPIAVPTE